MTVLITLSCNTVKQEKLPIEVVTVKEMNTFDTLLVAKHGNNTYLFSTKEVYLGCYDDEYSDETIISLMVGVLIGVLIIGIMVIKD